MKQVGNPETLVARTARELGRLSLDSEEGGFLGAESELLQRLGVSRPTLRQAAKIAENDCLITVRRGIRGGFFAARPQADDAIRTLARYLRLQGATLLDIMVVSRLVSLEAAELACACEDQVLRGELRQFAKEPDEDTPAGAVIAESHLSSLVARLSGNPAIELVMAIGFSFGMEEQRGKLYSDPGHRQRARELRAGLSQAILDRDADIAKVMMRRRSEAMVEWLAAA